VITPPESLVNLLKPWADFYGHSKAAVTIVTFLHIGGLLLAGGLAIATDRSTLRALRLEAAERGSHLRELSVVHKWVVPGLVVVLLSGVALVTADIETFWASWIYWLKMALVAALLVNGLFMTRVEHSLAVDASDGSPHWGTLRRVATASLALWFLIAALGVALVNYS
jgi:hypothetical protein